MTLDPAICYEALRSRDRRFEGRFVVAVRTTGIYCRPGCPARMPSRDHVRFYATPAAAEEAGFRPCLRCRPETAPSSAAWQGTQATVTRALRLLAHEPEAAGDLSRLAERLGIGPRHLRRLFGEHVGASPRAVVQSRRAHFARRLLEETDLPLETIALTAGYGSARRFRAAIGRAFGRAPHALRRRPRAATPAREPGAAPGQRPIELLLPYVPPYDWEAVLAYRAARAIPGVEAVAGSRYRRTIDGGRLEVAPAPAPAPSARRLNDRPALVLRLWLDDPNGLDRLVARARRMLDLEADPSAIADHLGHDRALARRVTRNAGMRIPGAWDPFELAVRAVLGQQVSVVAATTLAGRLVTALGTPAAGPDASLRQVFPSPARLAEAGETRLAAIGLTRARAATLAGLARACAEGRLVLDGARGLDATVSALTALPGIGPWTAHYVALRGLLEPDAFPAGDLGLRKALAPRGGAPLSEAALLARAERWRPWRGYAAIHLWHGDPPRGRGARS
jgi:AraC family transcriptional regulator of adaptative response / DNA-3-methyladenine glycosylase II